MNGHTFDVQYNFGLSKKIGEKISDELIQNRTYSVQAQVSKDNFKSFLDILIQDNKNPEINEKNYYDYSILNKEFNNYLKYLSDSKYDDIRELSYIYNAIFNESQNKRRCEEYISENLDNYIEHYKDNMAEIPITTLNNIFKHKNRILNNHERAYKFIKYVLSKSDNDRNKENVCILLKTLDGKNLTEESYKESIAKKEERYGFAPKFNTSFFDSINDNFSELNSQTRHQYESVLNEFTNQKQQMKNEIKQQHQQLMKELFDQYQRSMNEMKQQQQQVLNEIKEQQKQDTNEIKEQQKQISNDSIQQQQQMLNEIKAQQKQLSDDFKQQQQQSMNEIKEQQKQLLNDFKQQQQVLNEIKDQKQTINEIKEQQKQLLDDFKQQHRQSMNEIKEQQNQLLNDFKQQQQVLNGIKDQKQTINEIKEQQKHLLDDFKQQLQQSMNEIKEQQKQLLNDFNQQKQQVLNEIKDQKQIINEIKEQQKQLSDDFKQQQQQEMNENKEQQKQLLNGIKQQQQLIDQMKGSFEQKISLIQSSNESVSKKSDEMKNGIKTIESKIQQIVTACEQSQTKVQQFSDKNTETQNKINGLTDKINQIAQKCSDSYNCVQNFPNKITSIEDNINKIFDKVCDNLSISLANIGSFKGIIRQLTDQCGGNVSDKGIVDVTSSSVFSSSYLAKYAVDLDNNDTYSGSNDLSNSWLKYDFKDRRVRPICYLIRSSKSSDYLKNWVIEGSNSGSENGWTILDIRNNVTSLSELSAVQTFAIQKTNEFYRYLRIRMTGPNSRGLNYLDISALEYFGSIQ